MFEINKQKTKTIEYIIIGYLIGKNYGDVIESMRENLQIDVDNSVFDIAISNLCDDGIAYTWIRKLSGEFWISLADDF